MTTKQQHAVESLKRDILLHDGFGERHVTEYEYKQFDVTTTEQGGLFLVAEVGRKNDEGTMASIIARTRRLIKIGNRGGCTLLNPKGRKPIAGYWHVVHEITD